MIASKFATTSWSLTSKSGMLSLRKALNGGFNSSILFRNFNNDVREGVGRRAARTKAFIKEQTGFVGSSSSEAMPITLGKGLVAGASVIGLGSLCYYGLGFSNQAGILEKSSIWPDYVRQRISNTFQYLGGGLAVTAASAYGISRTPALMNLAMGSGWMAILASMALVIGSGMIVRSLPYEPGKLTSKQVAWVAHAALLGAFVAPLTLLGGAIMTRAALYTAGIVGGLSAVAATAPSEKFLNMGGPLAIGLGVVFAASLGSMFFPPTGRLGLSLYSVSIYGGLVLFSMFLLYDTQKIVKKAEYSGHFDPVNESISVYLDILNIFIRMSHILAGGGGKRK